MGRGLTTSEDCANRQPVSCLVCRREYPSHTKWRAHLAGCALEALRLEHGSLEQVPAGVSCVRCRCRFTTEIQLRKHWLMMHRPNGHVARRRPVSCVECRKTFKQCADFNDHPCEQHVRYLKRIGRAPVDPARLVSVALKRWDHQDRMDVLTISLECVRYLAPRTRLSPLVQGMAVN